MDRSVIFNDRTRQKCALSCLVLSSLLLSILLASFHPLKFKMSVEICIGLTDSSPPSIMTSLVRLSLPRALLFFISCRVFLTSDGMIS